MRAASVAESKRGHDAVAGVLHLNAIVRCQRFAHDSIVGFQDLLRSVIAELLGQCRRSHEVGEHDGFVGNYYDLTVANGRIDAVADHDPNYHAVSSAVWDPFQSWAQANHPEDADVLFGDDWWHTEESFRVWKLRLGEYIAEQIGS